MEGFNFTKTVYKFGILFSIEYLLGLFWIYFFHNYVADFLFENQDSLYEYISLIPRIKTTVFNIVYAILIFKYFRINNIKSHLIVVITLFFGFIGVALFFFQLLYSMYIEKTVQDTESKSIDKSQ